MTRSPRRSAVSRSERGRHRMWNPNGVDTKSRHLGKIALYQLIICILAAALVRPECAIGDAAHEEGLAVS